MAQRGNNGFTPYEGFDVLQNNFGISTVIVEGYKAMRSHCNSDFEESSEYKDCDEDPISFLKIENVHVHSCL